MSAVAQVVGLNPVTEVRRPAEHMAFRESQEKVSKCHLLARNLPERKSGSLGMTCSYRVFVSPSL